MNFRPNKRMLLIVVSAIDALLSGIILLIYFGILPIDISSSWGIQPWAVGLCGGVWFAVSMAIIVYQLTKTNISE